MTSDHSDWAETLREVLGDDLRMTAQYTEDEYEHLYIRDDVQQEYAQDELEDIRREIIVLQLAKGRIEDVTHAGKCRFLSYRLDDAFVYLIPKGGYTGRFVSVNPEATSKESQILDICSF